MEPNHKYESKKSSIFLEILANLSYYRATFASNAQMLYTLMSPFGCGMNAALRLYFKNKPFCGGLIYFNLNIISHIVTAQPCQF